MIREERPIVVYLHANASDKNEGMYFRRFYAQRNLSVCTFDMTGCGKSDGEHISLGVHEKHDLSAVIDHLRSLGYKKIGLWGRSMGAATVILYLAEHTDIACAVCDSSFSSLDDVIDHLAANEIGVPGCLVGYAKYRINNHLIAKHGFQISDLNIEEAAKKCKTPILLIHGSRDSFIVPEHCNKLHIAYGGEKRKMLVPIDHHSPHIIETYEVIFDFL